MDQNKILEILDFSPETEIAVKNILSKKLFSEIAPKFAERNGGYTRVLKTGPRRGDSAPMAIIAFVE